MDINFASVWSNRKWHKILSFEEDNVGVRCNCEDTVIDLQFMSDHNPREYNIFVIGCYQSLQLDELPSRNGFKLDSDVPYYYFLKNNLFEHEDFTSLKSFEKKITTIIKTSVVR